MSDLIVDAQDALFENDMDRVIELCEQALKRNRREVSAYEMLMYEVLLSFARSFHFRFRLANTKLNYDNFVDIRSALAARGKEGDRDKALHFAIRWEDETDGEDSLSMWKHMIEAGYLASRADVVAHVAPHIVNLCEPDLTAALSKKPQLMGDDDADDDDFADLTPQSADNMLRLMPSLGMPPGILASLRALSAMFCADLGLADEARQLAALLNNNSNASQSTTGSNPNSSNTSSTTTAAAAAAVENGHVDVESQLIAELCGAWLLARLDNDIDRAIERLDRLSAREHDELTYVAPLAASMRLLLKPDVAQHQHHERWLASSPTYQAAHAVQQQQHARIIAKHSQVRGGWVVFWKRNANASSVLF